MAILVDKNTKVVVQGITGREGEFHTQRMLEFGTNIVAGVTPGKGGSSVVDIPVFNTVEKAVEETGANTSCIFVPSPFAADAILEAQDAGIEVIVCITEGIPTLDMIEVSKKLKQTNTKLIGPNCPGIISPGKSKVGIIPNNICKEGPVGIVSRSGTLTYEIINELTQKNIGQSTCIGIGGDMIIGMRFVDILPLLENDTQTEIIVLIGEIGGRDEEVAADYIKKNIRKKVVSFISGKTAPEGKRMGHAGAIISGKYGTHASKVNSLKDAGVHIANTPYEIIEIVRNLLG